MLDSIQRSNDVTGYKLKRSNSFKVYRFSEILDSDVMVDFMASNGYSNENNNGNHTEDVTFATRVHEGFWTLFQFSEEVLYRSNELKKSAFALHEEGEEEEQQQNRQEADVPSLQYLGLHHRQGDWTIPSVKDTIHRATLKRRHIHYLSLLECYVPINTIIHRIIMMHLHLI